MRPSPTGKQAVVLQFVRRYVDEEGVAPTYKEIADGLGYASLGTVAEHLQALERKGFVELGDGKRSIRLVEGADLLEEDVEAIESALERAVEEGVEGAEEALEILRERRDG